MQELLALFNRLCSEACSSNHRRMLVVSGSRDWCYQQVSILTTAHNLTWIGAHAPSGVFSLNNQQCHKLLGQSIDHLVYDAWDGFNPNSFGQSSGCLSGGSVLVLLCPDLAEWPDYDDPEHHNLVAYPYRSTDAGRRFISRLVHLLEDDAYTLIVSEKGQTTGHEAEVPDHYPPEETAPVVLPSKTLDQQHAVELILSQFRRGRRPVVITADRGRGKSVALGIAAAQLSGLDYEEILITAPEFKAAEEAFLMAHQLLPDYEFSRGLLKQNQHYIRFVEPEQAISEAGEGKILLVDEAAAIPVPVLSKLLKSYTRIAFASTIHGYEGTGQGFAVRFQAELEREAPNCKAIHLQQPIRWSAGDPLEALVFNLLLLNAEAIDPEKLVQAYSETSTVIEKLDRDLLTEDYETLGQLFGLLVLAHYRTTPGDLRILLDSPNLHIWLLRCSGMVAGTVLIAEEGPLQTDLVEAIWSGQRRPRGHLLPQTLVNQDGFRDASEMRFGRIMRIAIHPALQRKGLGSELLNSLHTQAKSLGWDCLGSSFSASSDLLNFWQHNGFETVRIGSGRDHVSGNHAALVLATLSESGGVAQEHLRSRFLEQLNYRLSDDLTDLEPDVVCALLQHAGHLPEISSHDLSDLRAFTEHNRNYESCAYVIHKLLFCFLDRVDAAELQVFLSNQDFVLLLKRNLQQLSWDELEQNGQGRKQMMKQLRSVVSLMLEQVRG
ncbi:GNAT family N-acetyltransferase [Neptuniibacter sp.]|uniref:tRNA(Met) cytidine acetyltransferase TmcA n=1 Tax=Neptuniibacter sp. TaxID=1962643 RepID=UPI002615602A|nr:GNAT family N-acetyltransferase [Neptuniibacter sp.]MCP4595074.1 tRNA(Met) cytidine acetyltransferase [Neptuniibacter sp.]